MATEVVMPQMGESITEGTLTKWLKKTGDAVERDEPLFEISTDKVDAEIPSPVAGVVGEIKIEEGATVQINTVVCVVEEAGAAAATSAAPAPSAGGTVDLKADSATPAAEATAAQEDAINAGAPAAESAGGEEADAGTEVTMPQMGESITEGTLTKWLKNVGDTVARDEPIFEISTDKVDAEIPSPVAGKLTAIRVKEGETVTVGSVVAVIGGGAAKAAAPVAAAASASVPAAESGGAGQPSASAGEAPRSSPLVRKIAAENKVDLHQVSGTGSAGRITKSDILGHWRIRRRRQASRLELRLRDSRRLQGLRLRPRLRSRARLRQRRRLEQGRARRRSGLRFRRCSRPRRPRLQRRLRAECSNWANWCR